MAKKVAELEELLVEELQDIFDAEKQLVKALPKMAKSAADEELVNALREHLEVTKGQVQRLEQVFELMESRARSRPCKGMKGIVEEGKEMLEEEMEEGLLDAAIAGSARKVEHYEIVSYESVRAMALQLGRKDAAELLQQTLQEEMQADKLMLQISKRLLKETSAGGPPEEAEGRQASSRSGGNASGKKAGAKSRSAETSGGKAKAGRLQQGTEASAASRGLTDHEDIRQWAEDRGAHPACVKGTGTKGDTGMLRLDFPGFSGEDSLQEVSWDEWFESFDENNLALLVQEKTAAGQKSNFNKLVSRDTLVQKENRPKVRSAH